MSCSPETEREERLDVVLAAYLSAVRQGSGPERQQLLREHPDLAGELAAFFADQDRFERVAGPLRKIVPPEGRLSSPRDFGDYGSLEEIARGGMGVVFRAWQKSLGRPVALKMLLAGALASADDLRRFHIEAEAAASLDHPHIVPIYEVGDHDGHPYLSMRLIEGGSLAQVARREGWTVADRAGACRIARLMATVADAVHHAHQRGILHRDLKPANILLDSRSQPFVTDFGLARRSLPVTQTMEQPAAALTHTGAIVGTPAYMAPEQAGCRGSTTATDIYGLGAILYELLTGRAPFTGEQPLEVLRRVIDDEPAPPRTLNPQVPRDLEIICRKSLHKEPGRRYASAGDLAAELTRFVRGEPILARPTGFLERSWRWARRNPGIAILAVALVVTLVGGLGLTTWQWWRAEHNARAVEQERDRTRDALAVAETRRVEASQESDRARQASTLAEKRRQQAEGHARVANNTLHSFFTLSKTLIRQPGLQRFHKDLVNLTLTYCRDLLELRGNDFQVQVNVADALYNAALITESIGPRAESAATYRKALAIYRKALQERPRDVSLQHRLIFTLCNLSMQEDAMQPALALLHEARDLAIDFIRAHPKKRELRSGLANIYNNLGTRHIGVGRYQEGADYLRKAQEVEEGLVRDFPEDASHEIQLGRTLRNLGILSSRQGDHAQSLRYHSQAHPHFQKVARQAPHDPKIQADLARSSYSMALALRDVRKLDQAWTFLNESHRLRTRLVKENPQVLPYRLELAETDRLAGSFLRKKEHSDEALRCYLRARDEYADLVRLDPSSAAYRKDLAVCYFQIGCTHGAQKRRPEEQEAFGKARQLQEALLRSDPPNLDYRIDLGNTLHNLGYSLWKTGQRDEACKVLQQAITVSRAARVQAPRDPRFPELLAMHYYVLALIQREAGRRSEAVSALQEYQGVVINNASKLFLTARHYALLAADVGKGKKDLSAAELAERERYRGLTLDALRQAVARGFRDAAALEKEATFAPLKNHPDFQKLLRQARNARRKPG